MRKQMVNCPALAVAGTDAFRQKPESYSLANTAIWCWQTQVVSQFKPRHYRNSMSFVVSVRHVVQQHVTHVVCADTRGWLTCRSGNHHLTINNVR